MKKENQLALAPIAMEILFWGGGEAAAPKKIEMESGYTIFGGCEIWVCS